MQRATGEPAEALQPLPYPHEIGYLLGYFNEMSRMRSSNGMSVPHLCTEILTWQSLKHIELTEFELDVIWELDSRFVAHHSNKAEK